ncbi:HdeD family acid-resistance protein [Microbacterium karelineae]|uniref:HdeD family acid-resistance protein n=1 Tax=Microbacterium karelineae TaxID=2654283 RepID=UPI0018D2E164|nr:DUF308 domain-containing protein [Microbacterium karelineae]
MTSDLRPEFSLRQSLRTAILMGSIVSLVFGVVMLVWPVKSAMAVTILVAVYAVVGGLLHLAYGIFSRGTGGWTRAGLIVLGLVFLAAGAASFLNLGETTLLLAVIVTTFIGAAWIIDGVVALFSLGLADTAWPGGEKPHRGWTIAYAAVGILAGAFVIASPTLTALWLWIILGAALLVLGIVGICRAATLEK